MKKQTKKLFEDNPQETMLGNVVLGVEFQEMRKRWLDIRAKPFQEAQNRRKNQLSPTFPAIPTQKEK